MNAAKNILIWAVNGIGLGPRGLNPILLMELRTQFRERKIFVVQIVTLAFCCLVAMLVLIPQLAETAYRPESAVLGRALFVWLTSLQLLIIVLVSPAFSAGAISMEKERKTYDLLTSTCLKPGEIAAGKTLANLVFMGFFVTTTLPFVAIIFFLGGVSLDEMLIYYTFLFLAALLEVSLALMNSSRFSTNRSIMATYLTVVFGWIFVSLAFGVYVASMIGRSPGGGILGAVLTPAWQFTVPCLLIYSVLLAYICLKTSNNLKDYTGNRSTNMRLHFTTTFFSISALALLLFWNSLPPSNISPGLPSSAAAAARPLLGLFFSQSETEYFLGIYFGAVTAMLALSCLVFPCERWEGPGVRIGSFHRRLLDSRFFKGPATLYLPGPLTGAWFVLSRAVILYGVLLAILHWRLDVYYWPLLWKLTALGITGVFALVALCILIGTIFKHPRVPQAVGMAALIFVLFGPLPAGIRIMFNMETNPWLRFHYLNPLAVMVSLVDRYTHQNFLEDLPVGFGATVLLWAFTTAFYSIAALAFGIAAVVRLRRKGRASGGKPTVFLGSLRKSKSQGIFHPIGYNQAEVTSAQVQSIGEPS